MRHSIVRLLLVLFVATQFGCSQRVAPETPVESPLSTVSPLATPTSAYGQTSYNTPTPIAAPSSGKGAITGRFVDFESGEPAARMLIYLGELSPVSLEGEETHIVSMNPDSSPTTETDEQGCFAFQDVEPDTYAIVMWTPRNSWVVSNPDTDKDILITVEANEITALGEIETDLPG